MRHLSIACLLLGFVPAGFGQNFSRSENLAPAIPSPQLVVEKMLEAAHVKAGETVYDLGCGDGRILITAVRKFQAKAVGVELDKEIYRRAVARVKTEGLEDRIRLLNANLLNVDLSGADVVTLYLLTTSNDRLKPNLEKYLKPGARVVSNDYPIPGWKPHVVVRTMAGGLMHNIYVYEIGRMH